MTEEELLRRWAAERSLYEAWGEHVVRCVSERLAILAAPRSLYEIQKIPASPRVKTDSSFVDKALHRKRYQNPYDDVEDKVGARFVVLLTHDIRLVEQAIRDCGFETSKDRDYEAEREKKPLEFAYQSVHFVVRASSDIVTDGWTFPTGIPCEVQVRTLLQHAHSELTHDRIYKGQAEAPASVKRTVAKSMALIEATDDFFASVVIALDELDRPTRELFDALGKIYAEKIPAITPERAKSNLTIIEALRPVLGANAQSDVLELVNRKPYVIDKISGRALHRHLFRQPAIFLAYLGGATKPSETRAAWPLTVEELRPIFTDIGINVDDF